MAGRQADRAGARPASSGLLGYTVGNGRPSVANRPGGATSFVTALASFPVAILMTRKQLQRGKWSLPVCEAVGVVAGPQFEDATRSHAVVHSADGIEQSMWRGFRLELYRDAAENYWFNLTGAAPSLFVLCKKEGDGSLVPVAVTADHEESVSAVEHDGAAFGVPIPLEIHDALEQFVMEHFKPEEPRKRKQHKWDTGGQG